MRDDPPTYSVPWHGYDYAIPLSAVVSVSKGYDLTAIDGRRFNVHPLVRWCGIGDDIIKSEDGVYPVRWETTGD